MLLRPRCLSCLRPVVFVYTIRRSSIQGLNVQAGAAKAGIGFVAGALWSFLGIGGGPFNLAILTFFFAMYAKPAAQASLFIIAFSQTASLVYSLAGGGIPEFAPVALIGMCVAAVCPGPLWAEKWRRGSARLPSTDFTSSPSFLSRLSAATTLLASLGSSPSRPRGAS